MSRAVSSALMAAMYAQRTGEAVIVLVTLSHADFTTLRFAANTESVTHGVNTFTARGMEIPLPADHGDRPPEVTGTIEDVDQVLVTALRSVTPGTARPALLVELVRASAPTTAEASFTFEVRGAAFDDRSGQASLVLGFEPILDEPACLDTFGPTTYPDLFKAP